MELVLIFGVVAALIWGAVVVRFAFHKSLNPIPVLCLLTVVGGVVIGYDFFHTHIGPVPVTVDRILLGIVVGLYVFLFLLGYERVQTATKTDLLVFAFFGYMAMSTFAHEWSYMDNLPLTRLLFFNLMPLAMYLAIRNSRMESNDLRLISFVFAVLGVYLAITAFAEVRGWDWLVYPTYIMSENFAEFFGRGRGPTLNPISNGILMIICLCSSLMWWPHVGRRWRVLILLTVPIMLLGIFSTMTRSVWVAAAASLFLFAWMPAARPVKGILIAVSVVGILILAPLYGDEFSSFKRDKFVTESEMAQSATLRPLFAIVALRMLQDRPITGHGYGQYTQAKQTYLKDPTSSYPLSMTKAYMQHNILLTYLTELGAVGTGLFLMLMINLGVMARRMWYQVRSDLWVRQFGLLMGVVLICHLINGMFHDVSIIPLGNMLLFFFAGIATRLYNREPSIRSVDVPQSSSPSALAA